MNTKMSRQRSARLRVAVGLSLGLRLGWLTCLVSGLSFGPIAGAAEAARKAPPSEEFMAEVQPYIRIDSRHQVVGRDEFEAWHLDKLMRKVDGNGDGMVSLEEFVKALKIDSRASAFLDTSRFPLSVDRARELFRLEDAKSADAQVRAEFEEMETEEVNRLVRENPVRFGLPPGSNDGSVLYSRPPVLLTEMADRLDEQARTAEAEAETKRRSKTLLGFPWDKESGLIFGSPSKSDEDPQPDPDKSRVSLQILRDFSKSGATRKPALFQWSKNRGEDGVFEAAVAARLEYYNPNWSQPLNTDLTPAVGAEWTRNGSGAKRVDRRNYHLELSGYPEVFGVELGYVHIGPEVEQNAVKGTDYLKGVVEWELNLSDLPPFRYAGSWVKRAPVGVWNRMVPGVDPRQFGWYYRPRVALEPNTLLRQPAGGTHEDWVQFNYSLEVGARFFERFVLSYELAHAHQIDRWSNSYLMQKASLRVQLDSEDRFSLEFGFNRGREALDDDAVDRWLIGLGFKF